MNMATGCIYDCTVRTAVCSISNLLLGLILSTTLPDSTLLDNIEMSSLVLGIHTKQYDA